MKLGKCYFCRDEKQTENLISFRVDANRHILFEHYTGDKDYLACKNCYSQFVSSKFDSIDDVKNDTNQLTITLSDNWNIIWPYKPIFTEVHAKCKEGIILNSDWVDTSYNNDTCASFENKKHSIRLWIDYPNVEDRELSKLRFSFNIYQDLNLDECIHNDKDSNIIHLEDTYGNIAADKYIETEDINEFNKIIKQYK